MVPPSPSIIRSSPEWLFNYLFPLCPVHCLHSLLVAQLPLFYFRIPIIPHHIQPPPSPLALISGTACNRSYIKYRRQCHADHAVIIKNLIIKEIHWNLIWPNNNNNIPAIDSEKRKLDLDLVYSKTARGPCVSLSPGVLRQTWSLTHLINCLCQTIALLLHWWW